MEHATNTRMPSAGKRIEAVDLFCGAGGLTRGLLDAGVEVRAGVDVEGACRYPYERNNHATFVERSVEDVSGAEIASLYRGGGVRLLCGCAPCQTFSTMNQRNEEARRESGRWRLLDQFGRLVREVMPELVSMENVPGLEGKDVFERFVGTLSGLGYHASWRVVNCADYGMPQRRQRLVLLASRLGAISVPDPDPEAPTATVRDAIGSLPPLRQGETDAHDPLHSASRLSELNLRRVRASVPGGTWRDWDESLRLKCHLGKSGDGYGAVYGRMEWDRPAPTITTQFYNYGSGRFGHPEQGRALSLREGAMLQGFPAGYEFFDPASSPGRRKVGVLIGNAVPVGLGRLVGDTLLEHVRSLGR